MRPQNKGKIYTSTRMHQQSHTPTDMHQQTHIHQHAGAKAQMPMRIHQQNAHTHDDSNYKLVWAGRCGLLGYLPRPAATTSFVPQLSRAFLFFQVFRSSCSVAYVHECSWERTPPFCVVPSQLLSPPVFQVHRNPEGEPCIYIYIYLVYITYQVYINMSTNPTQPNPTQPNPTHR